MLSRAFSKLIFCHFQVSRDSLSSATPSHFLPLVPSSQRLSFLPRIAEQLKLHPSPYDVQWNKNKTLPAQKAHTQTLPASRQSFLPSSAPTTWNYALFFLTPNSYVPKPTPNIAQECLANFCDHAHKSCKNTPVSTGGFLRPRVAQGHRWKTWQVFFLKIILVTPLFPE